MKIENFKSELFSQALKIVLLVIVIIFLMMFNINLTQLRECLLSFLKISGQQLHKNMALHANETLK